MSLSKPFYYRTDLRFLSIYFVFFFVGLAAQSHFAVYAGPGIPPTAEIGSWDHLQKRDPLTMPIPVESAFYKDVLKHYLSIWKETLKVYRTWITSDTMLTAAEKKAASERIENLEAKGAPKLFIVESSQSEAYYFRNLKNHEIVLSTELMQSLDYQLDSVMGVLAHELTHAIQINEILESKRVAEEQADALSVKALTAGGYSAAGMIKSFNTLAEKEEESQKNKEEESQRFNSPLNLIPILTQSIDPHRLHYIRARQVEALGPFAPLDPEKTVGKGLSRTHHEAEIVDLWAEFEKETVSLSNQQFAEKVLDLYESYVGEDENFTPLDFYQLGGFQPLFQIWAKRIRSSPINSKQDFESHFEMIRVIHDLFQSDLELPIFSTILEEAKRAAHFTRFTHFVPEISFETLSPKDSIFAVLFELSRATRHALKTNAIKSVDADSQLRNTPTYFHDPFELNEEDAQNTFDIIWFDFERLLRIEEATRDLERWIDGQLLLTDDKAFDEKELGELIYQHLESNFEFMRGELGISSLNLSDSTDLFNSPAFIKKITPKIFFDQFKRLSEVKKLSQRWEMVFYIVAPYLLERFAKYRLEEGLSWDLVLEQMKDMGLEHARDDEIVTTSEAMQLTSEWIVPSFLIWETDSFESVKSDIRDVLTSDAPSQSNKSKSKLSSIELTAISTSVSIALSFYEEWTALRTLILSPDFKISRQQLPEYFVTRYGPEIDQVNFSHSDQAKAAISTVLENAEPSIHIAKPFAPTVHLSFRPKQVFSTLEKTFTFRPHILEKAHALFDEAKRIVSKVGFKSSVHEIIMDMLDAYGGYDLFGRSYVQVESYELAAGFLKKLMIVIFREEKILEALDLENIDSESAIWKILDQSLVDYELFSDEMAVDGAFSFLMHHPEFSDEIVSRQIVSRIQKKAFEALEKFKPWVDRSFEEKNSILAKMTHRDNVSIYLDSLLDNLWSKAGADEIEEFVNDQNPNRLGYHIASISLSPILRQKIAGIASLYLPEQHKLSDFFETVASGSSTVFVDLWEEYLSVQTSHERKTELKIDRGLVEAIEQRRDQLISANDQSGVSGQNMFSQVFHGIDIAIRVFDARLLLRLTFNLADPEHYDLSREEEDQINNKFAEETPYAAFGGVKILRLYYESLTESHRHKFLSYMLWSHPSALFQQDILREIASVHPLFSQESHSELTRLKTVFWETLPFQDRAVLVAHSLVAKYRGTFFSNHEFIVTSLELLQVVGRKTAQLLSAHGSFVPDALRKKLQIFRDQNPHSKPLKIIHSIDSDLHAHKNISVWQLVDFFGSILGAGSMKTPIHATLHNGEEVVMKQLDPEVLARVDRNLLVLESGLKSWLREGNSEHHATILILLSRLRESIRLEMSIDRENRNTLEHTRLQLARGTLARPLELIESLSTPGLSTVRFIPNKGNANTLVVSPPTAEAIVDEVVSQLVADHWVHGDLQNPANILIDTEDRPVFIDLSLSRSIEPNDIALVLKLHETLSQITQSFRSTSGSWLFKLRALAGQVSSAEILVEFRKNSPGLVNNLEELIDLLTYDPDNSNLDHQKGRHKDTEGFMDQLLKRLVDRFLSGGKDSDYAQTSSASKLTIMDLFLEVERLERVISERYVFLIEILSVVYQYENLAMPTGTAHQVMESVVHKMREKLNKHHPSQSADLQNQSLGTVLLLCRQAFQRK